MVGIPSKSRLAHPQSGNSFVAAYRPSKISRVRGVAIFEADDAGSNNLQVYVIFIDIEHDSEKMDYPERSIRQVVRGMIARNMLGSS